MCFFETHSLGWLVIDKLLYIVFLIEIILNFFTPYYDGNVLVTNHVKIAKRELLSFNFWISLLTILPYDIIFNLDKYYLDSYYPLIELVVLIRFIDIISLYSRIKGKKSQNKVIKKFFAIFNTELIVPKIMTIIFFVWLICHIIACIWHYLGYYQNDGYNWITRSNFIDEQVLDRYMVSLYFVYQTVSPKKFKFLIKKLF